MKLFLIALFGLMALAACEEPILLHYHENVGIREAERIRQAELAVDFDGSRIVGGSAANLGDHPYMGGLLIVLPGALSVCGSTLVSNNRVVTAAHCWWDGRIQAQFVTVVLGSVCLFNCGDRFQTRDVQMHPNYNPNTLRNNIAIITTRWTAYNNVIRNIGLASGNNNFAGTWARAAGWGKTSDSDSITSNNYLRHVSLQVITNAVCAQTFGSTIIDSTLCTSGAGGRSTCGGDSGGPLVANNVLIGIASFNSANGCQRGFPSGFTRVSSFNNWIRANL